MHILPKETNQFETFVSNFIKRAKEISLDELGKILERIDKFLYIKRPSNLKIIKLKERSILTSLGMLHFKRRYYYDELDHQYLYLLDSFMHIPKRSKVMNDIRIKIIEAASMMSYSKAGRYGSIDNYPVSKSTVCRLIAKADYYVDDNLSIIKNDDKVHIQIDEKFVSLSNEKNKKRHYTATIFKGVKNRSKKRILLNRSLLSHNNQYRLFDRINHLLVNKYHIKSNEEAYVSGDLARYIQNAPDKILVCKALYVPDKYHIKQALKDELGIITSDQELNDKKYLMDVINALDKLDSVNARKLRTLFKRNPNCLRAYLDDNYEGCSQECMNSHYYCPRFNKVPNKFNSETVNKLAMINNAILNESKIQIGFKEEFYDEVNNLDDYLNPLIKETKYDLDTREMKYESHVLFERIKYGY